MIETCILILAGTMALAVYHSPKALRHLAAHSLTRAQVIEAAAKAHDDGLKEWRRQLGLDHERCAAQAIREIA